MDQSSGPRNICLLGSRAVVTNPQLDAHALEQARSAVRGGSRVHFRPSATGSTSCATSADTRVRASVDWSFEPSRELSARLPPQNPTCARALPVFWLAGAARPARRVARGAAPPLHFTSCAPSTHSLRALAPAPHYVHEDDLRRDRAGRGARLVHQVRRIVNFGFDLRGLAQDVGIDRDVGLVAAEGAVAAGADAVEELGAEALAHHFTGVKLHFFALEVVGGLGVAGELHAGL